jgi:hypothetical protein
MGWIVCFIAAALITACDDDSSEGGNTTDTSGTSGTADGTSGTSGTTDTSGTSGTADGTSGTSGTTDTNVGVDTVSTSSGSDTSGVTDDAADTSGGDTSGVTPLPDPTPEAVAACADLSTAICDIAQRCPELGGEGFDYAQCLQLISAECELGTVLPDSNQTAAVMQTCADTIPLLQCADVQDIQSLEQLCSVPSGSRADGEGCARNVQCAVLNCNISTDNYPCGTCGAEPPLAQENEACDNLSLICAEGLVCNTGGQAEGICQPPPPPKGAGEACEFGEVCVEGYTCTADFLAAGTCDPTPPPIEEGQACEFGQACAEGLVCTADFAGPGTCVAPVAQGGDCSAADAVCVQGLVCTGGTCQTLTPVAEGGQCLTDDFQLLPCVAGTSCSFIAGVCEPNASPGEACDPFFGPQCAGGAQCSAEGVCEVPNYGACE